LFGQKKYLPEIMDNFRLIGVDPGSTIGVCVIDSGQIVSAFEVSHDDFWIRITNLMLISNLMVAVEDIKPYSLPLNPNVIETCKWIGEAVYRLKTSVGCRVEMVSRFQVKKWCFDTFPDICIPLINTKIEKGVLKGKYIKKDGENRSASFHFVDDRIVTACMTNLWKIEKGKQGRKTPFGLKLHSFQALAVASYQLNALKNETILPQKDTDDILKSFPENVE
jgi:hypothetical protein